MDIGSCFDKTLNKFGISGAWLSQQSGVNPQMISRFRNDKEVQTDTLEKLLEPLPVEAKEYFFTLLLGSKFRVNLEILVDTLSSDELHDLFDLAARRITKRSRQLEILSQAGEKVPA
jgi:DNA-binding Xre family transcriptional regulator